MARIKTVTLHKKYTARKGGPLRDADAQLIGQRIEHLMSVNGRSVTPKDLVSDASSRKSPLHKYFEWKDEKAAELFRIKQAQYLLNHIIVHVEYEGKSHQSRAFINVKDDEDNASAKRVFVEVERALTSTDLRAQMISDALREANYWRSKYAMLTELNTIFQAIEQAEKVLSAKDGKRVELRARA